MKKNDLHIMLILFVSGLVIMMNLYLTIPLTKTISSDFNVSLNSAGLLSSFFSIGFALGCLIYGTLSEKIGRKQTIFIGIICLTLITLIIGLSNSFYLILFLRFLQGLAAATFSPVALAFAGEFFKANQKTTAIGLISTGFLMAGILGQVLSTTLNQLYSFQSIFLVMSLLLCLCTLGLFIFLPKDSNTKNVSFFKNFANLKNILKKQSLLLCYLIAFLLLLSFVLMYSFFMSKLAIEPYNLSTSEQLKIRLIGLLGMIVSPLAGKLSAKVGIKNLLVYSLSLTVISSILFIFSKSLVILTILSVIFVLGIALAVPSLVTLVNFFGAFERGLSVSIYTFILFLGTSFAPVIVSFSTTFSKTNINFSILSMITLISFITSLIIKRK